MKKTTITKVTIKKRVIYIRFKGTYAAFRRNSKKMFAQLFSFAEKNNLIDEGETKVLTIYHDNPFITDEKNLKTSVAMTIPHDANITLEGEICDLSFSGRYAVLEYDLSMRDYGEAWKDSYDWLLNQSGEVPRDDFPFELYVTEPPKNYKDTSITSINLPIE